jgi:A/G-specific adenine glycosylase
VLTELSQRLLDWYPPNARRLPWRAPPAGQRSDPTVDEPQPPDAYAVWVSEIMLQQTQVETVIPYYEKWLAHFPTLAALAAASEQAVLSVWEGLGYYSRARNLQRAAQQIASEWDGRLPPDRKALERLPGIGRTTAGAIASIAFGQDEPALDGNIRRVMARVFDVRLPARSPQGEKRLWELVEENLPPGRAGDYNQALMDLGATLCTPHAPACRLCPLAGLCQAHALGVQEQRPVIQPRRPVPHYTVTAAVLEREERVLIARRPSKGLLGGLWEFPGGKQKEGEDLPACLRRELREELGVETEVGTAFGQYQHAYTHFRVTLHAYRCRLLAGEPQPLAASELQWVTPAQLKDFPMGKIDRQIARRLASSP